MEEKKFCPRCGKEVPPHAAYCPNCGTKIDENYTASFEEKDGTTSDASYTSAPNYENTPKKKSKDEEMLEDWLPLVCAIVSYFTGGLVLGILAIYFANKNPKGQYSSVSKALGIISIILWALGFLLALFWIIYYTQIVIRYLPIPNYDPIPGSSSTGYTITVDALRALLNL